MIITNATASSLVLNETGNYHVRVKFGDCLELSEKTTYRINHLNSSLYDVTTNNDSTNNYSL
jgi:urease accessory protein UreE